jgi:hypothetical protein
MNRVLRSLGKKLGLLQTATLPIPFYRVLEEELKRLRSSEQVRLSSSNWLVTDDQVTDWEGLRTRWDLLGLEDLCREVSGTGGHRWRAYVKNLAESCSELMPKAKPAFNRLEKFLAVQEPATGAAPTESGLLVKKMADLVGSAKCLYRYSSFPTAHLGNAMLALARSFHDEEDPANVLELNRLLLEELFPEQIRKAYESNLQTVYKSMRKAELSALCFSGGGIRSATFCLGILQGLAKRGVLQKFDYLSTVSGGGYIGSWLSAWMHHSGAQAAEVFDELNLKEPGSRIPAEPKEIVHLRQYGNYLAPRLGLLSGDTWVLIGTFLRNLLLNWIVFVPFLLAACAIPRLYVGFLSSKPTNTMMVLFFCGGVILSILAMAYACVAHPGAEGKRKSKKPQGTEPEDEEPTLLAGKRYGKQAREFIRLHGQGAFFVWCLAPICVSAVLFTTFWFWFFTPGTGSKSIFGSPAGGPDFRSYVFLGVAVASVGWLLAQVWVVIRTKAIPRIYLPGVEVGTGLVAGGLLYLLAHLAFPLVHQWTTSKQALPLYTSFAAPAFLVTFLVAGTLFVGFSSRLSSDEDREWWARMGAWILVVAMAWSAVSAWLLLGPLLFFKAAALVGSVGGISGVVTLVLGHSGLTAANLKGQQPNGQPGKLVKYSLTLAAPIFLASILTGLSMVVGWLIYLFATADASQVGFYHRLIGYTRFPGVDPWSPEGYLQIIDGTWRRLAGNFILLSIALGLVVSLAININRFSLHAVYRNRLVRAYLGASNPKRRPNRFTGFDPKDNFALGSLREKRNASATERPLHIINMALNLVGGKELAWQQRKAETFTASKLFTGNFRLGFRKTCEYASSELNRGLTLGTAMAISGAAANPNMGYHSSPVVAFLMTLFNIRLGCWLGNPGPAGQRAYKSASPPVPIWYAAKEALGLTDDASRFVCLSDGGHFENLGLYEMVLRRCKTIVVCDAGCDPSCSLEDLGNAIRKIRADLGVSVGIETFSIYSRDDKRYAALDKEEIGRYCAVGEIDYEPGKETDKGTLIYIKPAICGREPKDVFNYKQMNPAFPHESTADQFFSESQFESYRALGAWVIDRIYENEPKPTVKGLENFTTVATDYSNGDGEQVINDLHMKTKSKSVLAPRCAGFSRVDIGAPQLPGSSTQVEDGWDFVAGGADIWQRFDQFHFVCKQFSGDFDIAVRIETFTPAHLYSKAGLMIRDSLNADSAHLMFLVFSDNSPRNNNLGAYEMQFRSVAGTDCQAIYPAVKPPAPPEFPAAFPHSWLRVQRRADRFSAFASTDGKTWKVYALQTLALEKTLYVGPALTSHNPGQTAQARFRNYTEIK